MAACNEPDPDACVFGYRWTTGERMVIHFDSKEEVDKEIAAAMLQRRRKRTRQQMLHPSLFEKLPLEIIHLVLQNLDPGTLASLAQVNSALFAAVHSLPAFRNLLRYAPQVLKALGRTRLVHQYDVSRLHHVLQTDRCEYCFMYGSHLYLLKCSRCCIPCLKRDLRLASTTWNKAKKACGSSHVELKAMSKLFTIPGDYTRSRYVHKKRLWLVNWNDLRKVLGKEPGRPMPILLPSDQLRFSCHAAVAMPSVSFAHEQATIQHGVWCRGCEDEWYFWDNNPFFYTICHDPERLFDSQEKCYTKDEFAEHCKTCPGVKRLKALDYPNVRCRGYAPRY